MVVFLYKFSQTKLSWLLLSLTAFFLEVVALFFQHVMGLKPCVLCIYERCAILGILGAGFLGFIAPKTRLRYASMALWAYSSWTGLRISWEHSQMQLNPSPFMTCDFAPKFPHWLPLDKWLPQFFSATGDCSVRQWHFMSLEMPQWLVIIFSFYFFVSIFVFYSQFFKK
ncbi:disulfide bond formation protein DsbB [Enterobacter sp. ASE]|uniref:disulfide bond formation protein DsbB n=1 Tax=Enterobacter sp. ASE TaxID=2905968 RepID=UPI001E5E7B5E|nr:disulfide bond formation protein DsbB [Enterobacter sp. ASE]MCE3115185.1 disulfide bond formation protein DsbB [Enterobacter sp. ASE]